MPPERLETAPHRVQHPAELLAALPALLGFHPGASLVLVALGGASGRRLGLALRADLPPPGGEPALATRVARALLLDAPVGAVAVVVDGSAPGSNPPRGALVEHTAAALAASGIELRAALWAHATTAGAPWGCFGSCGCRGMVPDPCTSPFVAASVVEGRVVHADRAALRRAVAPAADGRLRRRERLLVAALDRALETTPDPWPVPGTAPDPDRGEQAPATAGEAPHATGTALVDAALRDVADGRLRLDDERVVALALALADPAVRDAALLRSAGATAVAAEQLWAALARETPAPEAAEPAALLAVSALLRGDGAMARVALDRAEDAWPGHRLTRLLRAVVDAGMSPQQVRACLGVGEPPVRRAPTGGGAGR